MPLLLLKARFVVLFGLTDRQIFQLGHWLDRFGLSRHHRPGRVSLEAHGIVGTVDLVGGTVRSCPWKGCAIEMPSIAMPAWSVNRSMYTNRRELWGNPRRYESG